MSCTQLSPFCVSSSMLFRKRGHTKNHLLTPWPFGAGQFAAMLAEWRLRAAQVLQWNDVNDEHQSAPRSNLHSLGTV